MNKDQRKIKVETDFFGDEEQQNNVNAKLQRTIDSYNIKKDKGIITICNFLDTMRLHLVIAGFNRINQRAKRSKFRSISQNSGQQFRAALVQPKSFVPRVTQIQTNDQLLKYNKDGKVLPRKRPSSLSHQNSNQNLFLRNQRKRILQNINRRLGQKQTQNNIKTQGKKLKFYQIQRNKQKQLLNRPQLKKQQIQLQKQQQKMYISHKVQKLERLMKNIKHQKQKEPTIIYQKKKVSSIPKRQRNKDYLKIFIQQIKSLRQQMAEIKKMNEQILQQSRSHSAQSSYRSRHHKNSVYTDNYSKKSTANKLQLNDERLKYKSQYRGNYLNRTGHIKTQPVQQQHIIYKKSQKQTIGKQRHNQNEYPFCQIKNNPSRKQIHGQDHSRQIPQKPMSLPWHRIQNPQLVQSSILVPNMQHVQPHYQHQYHHHPQYSEGPGINTQRSIMSREERGVHQRRQPQHVTFNMNSQKSMSQNAQVANYQYQNFGYNPKLQQGYIIANNANLNNFPIFNPTDSQIYSYSTNNNQIRTSGIINTGNQIEQSYNSQKYQNKMPQTLNFKKANQKNQIKIQQPSQYQNNFHHATTYHSQQQHTNMQSFPQNIQINKVIINKKQQVNIHGKTAYVNRQTFGISQEQPKVIEVKRQHIENAKQQVRRTSQNPQTRQQAGNSNVPSFIQSHANSHAHPHVHSHGHTHQPIGTNPQAPTQQPSQPRSLPNSNNSSHMNMITHSNCNSNQNLNLNINLQSILDKKQANIKIFDSKENSGRSHYTGSEDYPGKISNQIKYPNHPYGHPTQPQFPYPSTNKNSTQNQKSEQIVSQISKNQFSSDDTKNEYTSPELLKMLNIEPFKKEKHVRIRNSESNRMEEDIGGSDTREKGQKSISFVLDDEERMSNVQSTVKNKNNFAIPSHKSISDDAGSFNYTYSKTSSIPPSSSKIVSPHTNIVVHNITNPIKKNLFHTSQKHSISVMQTEKKSKIQSKGQIRTEHKGQQSYNHLINQIQRLKLMENQIENNRRNLIKSENVIPVNKNSIQIPKVNSKDKR